MQRHFLSFNGHLLVFKIGIAFQYFLVFYMFSLNSNALVLRRPFLNISQTV